MTDRLYRAAPGDQLRMETLGALVMVYDRRSTQTHVLAPPLPEILHVMGADNCGAADITNRLARDYDFDESGDAASIVAERLTELRSLGLIELL